MDISDLNAIYYAIEKYEPTVIVNTAAYTAVDKAEDEITAAMQANPLVRKIWRQHVKNSIYPYSHFY